VHACMIASCIVTYQGSIDSDSDSYICHLCNVTISLMSDYLLII